MTSLLIYLHGEGHCWHRGQSSDRFWSLGQRTPECGVRSRFWPGQQRCFRREVVTLLKNVRFQRDPKEDVLGAVLLFLTVGMHCFSSCGTSLLLFCILRGAGGYCQRRARTCSYTVNIPAQRDMYGIENKCKHKKRFA